MSLLPIDYCLYFEYKCPHCSCIFELEQEETKQGGEFLCPICKIAIELKPLQIDVSVNNLNILDVLSRFCDVKTFLLQQGYSASDIRKNIDEDEVFDLRNGADVKKLLKRMENNV